MLILFCFALSHGWLLGFKLIISVDKAKSIFILHSAKLTIIQVIAIWIRCHSGKRHTD